MQSKEYKARWMREWRAKKKKEQIIAKGRCPTCTMLLNPEYDIFHRGCPYWEKVRPTTASEETQAVIIISTWISTRKFDV